MYRRRRDISVWRGVRRYGRLAMRPLVSLPVCLAIAAAGVLTGASARAGTFDVIAETGDASPDGNGELVTFTAPALNNAGQVAFLSFLDSTNEPFVDDEALFRGTTSGLSVIARKGVTQLDGSPISAFVNLSPAINAAGVVSHSADRDAAPGEYLAFLSDGGALSSYLHVDSSSPSGMNELSTHTIPAINDNGVAAYRASYFGVNSEFGIYSRASNGVTTLRVEEGLYGPMAFLTLSQSLPTINESSQIGLTASIDDGSFTRKAVMRLDDTTLVELARDGSMTTNGITTIANILSNAVPINASGQIAFEATYTQSGVSLRQGVFLVDDDGRTLLTPNLLPGSATTATNVRTTAVNDAGKVSFTSEFTGGGVDPNSGVYLADTAGTTLVAFEDSATPEGTKFFRRFFTESVALNQNSQLAFLAELSDTANGAAAGRGLYRFDPTTGLEQIMRSGDAFLGSTIASLNFVGDFYSAALSASSRQAPDSDFSGLNNAGQLAFVYSLVNGESGIAIWSPDVVSLPGDYNSDGHVDAADYTVWRNHLNQSFALDNENPDAATPGLVDQEDYLFWKSNYGNSSGGGSISTIASGSGSLAVPEPTTALLAFFASLVLACMLSGRLVRR
jgi:hypothetical protein